MARGYIYVLFNPGLRNNQFKIGLTTQTPEERARDLSRATGVPQPYEVLHSVYVEDCSLGERLVHERLASYRLAKEFFEIPLNRAIDTINEVASVVGRVPESELGEKPAETGASNAAGSFDGDIVFSTHDTRGRHKRGPVSEHSWRKIAIADHLVIEKLVKDNPKRGAAALRFAEYRDGMTVAQALNRGVTAADVKWDVSRGFITLREPDANADAS